MAWPSEAGSVAGGSSRLPARRRPARARSFFVQPPALRPRPRSWFERVPAAPRRHAGLRGKYRVFNAAGYRFYRSSVGPPVESDTPFATNATLPHEPADLFADGPWWLSVSYFNGVIDSGFLPLGPSGETYIRIDVDSTAPGGVGATPPAAPNDLRLALEAGGVVRVLGCYLQAGGNRATQWAITYTTDGSDPLTPPAVAPDVVAAVASSGVAVLSHALPAQADGTTVKARVQTRRPDGAGFVYSEGSAVMTATADAVGPSAPAAVVPWDGAPPEGV